VIVLDENLKDPQIAPAFRTWYRGRVCSVNELRPATIIKDDAIEVLLREHPGSILITRNEGDFWKRLPTDPSYCLIEVSPRFDPRDLPNVVRSLFRLTGFQTRKERSGKIARVTQGKVEYYTHWSSTVVSLDLRIG
jgi:hypothetical protein